MTIEIAAEPRFADLGLAPAVLRALDAVGYEHPTPIQKRTIPPLLAGRDVLGQAQTGTGKTAAFALPLLSRLDPAVRAPQVLVLTPTRELAMQVAEAFRRYAAQLSGVEVLAIYGGQAFFPQLNGLKRGAQVIVGTPGRVMDHLRRGTLSLAALTSVVLDEADEMLRMGFIDDVEHILGKTPAGRQLALFSATLPGPVQSIARRHLSEPAEIRLESRSTASASVRQRVWMVAGTHKLDALTRMLEVEPFDAVIVFVRTKNATVDLAERLTARGFSAAAINGDLAQPQRERLIADLKSGAIDVLVATDVAARGLDVERVSHVVNFDVPYDAEAYVHRIGRTGRAGRPGDAILFVAARERHMLKSIERATGTRIETMELPSHEAVKAVRVRRFFDAISRTLAEEDLTELADLLQRYQLEHGIDPALLAAALARQTATGAAVAVKPRRERTPDRRSGRPAANPSARDSQPDRRSGRPAANAAPFDSRPGGRSHAERAPSRTSSGRSHDKQSEDIEVFRLEVGRDHGAGPGNIVGAIINEAGVARRYVGKVDMAAEHSTVELPVGMPREIFAHLKKVRVAGRPLNISRVAGGRA